MDVETIKEYLVGLGFEVDNASLNKFQQAIKDLSKQVEGHTSGMAKNYATAAGIIATAITAVTTATVTLMDKVAQSDLGYQLSAMRMYMNTDAAKKLKIALDALGHPLEEVAYNQELRGQFGDLVKLQGELQAQVYKMAGGKEQAEAQLKYIREIGFEFKKLKMQMGYGSEMVVVSLFKAMGMDIKDAHDGMQKLNDYIQEHMQAWAPKIAEGLKEVIQLGKTLWRVLKDVYSFFEKLPGAVKVGAGAGGLIALFLGVGGIPIIGQFIQTVTAAVVILTGLLLLIKDFYAYLDGEKSNSTLAPIWKFLIAIGTDLKNLWTDLKDLLNDLFGDSFHFDSSLLVDSFKAVFTVVEALAHVLIMGARAAIGLVDALALLGKDDGGAAAGERLHKLSEDLKKDWEKGDRSARGTSKGGATTSWGDDEGKASDSRRAATPPKSSTRSWGDDESPQSSLLKDRAATLLTRRTNNETGEDKAPGTRRDASAGPQSNTVMDAARKVEKKTGVPAEWVFGQWYHETGGFTNRGTTELNNLAGIRYPGRKEYRKFDSVDDFADYFSRLLSGPRYSKAGVQNAKSSDEYAAALKKGGYYEDSYENYATGLKRGINAFSKAQQNYQAMTGNTAQYQPAASGSSGDTDMSTSIGSLTINVPGTNASPDDIRKATLMGIMEAQGQKTQRQQREFSGVFA